MIKTNRWYPDTCGCWIDFQWDTEVPADSRVHTAIANNKCVAHAGVADVAAHYTTVIGENQRKNRTLGAALEAVSAIRDTGVDGSYTLKNGITFNYSFDAGRVMHVSFTGVTLTNPQKTTLQNWCNTNIGPGLVVVE